MTVRKRGSRFHYDFMIRTQRYRGAIPEARTKAEAEQAEVKIKNKIYERKFGKISASKNFADFVTERIYRGPGRISVPAVTMNYTQAFFVGTLERRL